MKDQRTYKIIGAAMEVHKELGCGFLEAVYQEALEREFGIQGILNKAQPIVNIKYKGEVLDKKYQPDFVCYGEIIARPPRLSESRSRFSMFYTYVLLSEKDEEFYVGFAQDLKKRLEKHQIGKVKSTANRRPLKLIYYEACLHQQDAIKREKYFKSGFGRRFLKNRMEFFFKTV